jgi:hypothetical protein
MTDATCLEIDALPAGRLLDAYIAERFFGYKRLIAQRNGRERVYLVPADNERPPHGNAVELYGDLWIPYDLPHYSSDIAATWNMFRRVKDSTPRHAFIAALRTFVPPDFWRGEDTLTYWLLFVCKEPARVICLALLNSVHREDPAHDRGDVADAG